MPESTYSEEDVQKLKNDLELDKGCILIAEAGHELGCHDVTICKAMLIYHRFQKSKEQDFFFQLIATAAFDVSTQICEEDIKTEDAIRVFRGLGAPSQKSEFPEERLREVQSVVCRTVFDNAYRDTTGGAPTFETAHRYVYEYLRQFRSVPQVQKSLVSVQSSVLRLLATFYQCRKCLSYDPLDIARASLRLALSFYGIKWETDKTLSKELIISDLLLLDDIALAADIATEDVDYSPDR